MEQGYTAEQPDDTSEDPENSDDDVIVESSPDESNLDSNAAEDVAPASTDTEMQRYMAMIYISSDTEKERLNQLSQEQDRAVLATVHKVQDEHYQENQSRAMS